MGMIVILAGLIILAILLVAPQFETKGVGEAKAPDQRTHRAAVVQVYGAKVGGAAVVLQFTHG